MVFNSLYSLVLQFSVQFVKAMITIVRSNFLKYKVQEPGFPSTKVREFVDIPRSTGNRTEVCLLTTIPRTP